MNRLFSIVFVVLFLVSDIVFAQKTVPCLMTDHTELRTIYQQNGRYGATFDLKTDGVMVYGISDTDIKNYPEWSKKSGSILQVMTGVAWGDYKDYLDGHFDGVDHHDDSQVKANGESMLHGPGVPYLNPSIAFGNYLVTRLKKVVDAGMETIYLEEPEFWAFTGYGESFQREWRIHYGHAWQRPDTSCDNLYRANILKWYLYRRLLSQVCSSVKEYSLKKYNRPLTIYIATHSLISYAQIQMVSPESALIDIPEIDGIIAQTWTGTARVPNIYQGITRERTFESAFLEYSVSSEMTRGTGKRTYLLNDPVEDDRTHDWNDYRQNYLATQVASLMQTASADYEVAPWPQRVFCGAFPEGTPNATTIPEDYASTLNVVFNQLRDMNQKDISWNGASENIGILISDSIMFQRGCPKLWKSPVDITANDRQTNYTTEKETRSLNGFFSLALPLLKNGVPVSVPILDHVIRFPGYLDSYRVLFLSYEFQKPLVPAVHIAIADWVRQGGVLVYVGADTDSFHRIKAWWNSGKLRFTTPVDHLLATLGLESGVPSGQYTFGKGSVLIARCSPANYGRSEEGTNEFLRLVKQAFELAGIKPVWRNYLLLNRGPYVLASVLDETKSTEPLHLHGHYIDLFSAQLKILNEVTLPPGTRCWLLDLDSVYGKRPMPLCCGGRISDWTVAKNEIRFSTSSPAGIKLKARILLNDSPLRVIVNKQTIDSWQWDKKSQTLFLSYPVTSADPVCVQIQFSNGQ